MFALYHSSTDNTMAEIGFSGCSSSIEINIDSWSSEQAMIVRLKELLNLAPDVYIICDEGITIEEPLFSDFTGNKLRPEGIILSEVALKSIPKTVKSFETDLQQALVEQLDVEKLGIPLQEGIFKLQDSVTELSIYSEGGNATIQCTNNLKTFELDGKNTVVTLTNCNDLKELKLTGHNTFVYGEFQSQVESLEMLQMVNQAEYIRSFTNLKKLTVWRDIHCFRIQDIPDSIETFDAILLDNNDKSITSGDILAKKPNITSIRFNEKLDIYHEGKLIPGMYQALDRYPNVQFILHGNYHDSRTMKSIRLHNKNISG